MLNRLSTVLQSAADALAPPPPPLEDLKYHWKLVMRFYSQRSIHSKCPIEETNIPSHLEQLLKILVSEGASLKSLPSEGACTTAGPCLEFLLQHRLLELLVSLAQADSPPGMRRYLFGYLKRFVVSIPPHLLTLASIHLPLLRIIFLCCKSKASPTEVEEIEFLLALCQIIHKYPYLSIIFNKEAKPQKHSESSGSISSGNSTFVEINRAAPISSEVTMKNPSFTTGKEEKSQREISQASENGVLSPLSLLPDNHSAISEKQQDVDSKESRGTSNLSSSDMSVNRNKENSLQLHNYTGSHSKEKIKDSQIGNSLTSPGKENYRKTCQEEMAKSHATEQIPTEQSSAQMMNEPHLVHSQTTSGSCTPELVILGDPSDADTGEGRLPLLDAVLGYINSADSVTKLHVCEALLMLVSSADEMFSNAIVRTSHLGLVMAEKLTSSFQEIPSDVDPDHFEDIPQNWGPKNSQLWLKQHAFPGSRLVASFVSWLNFCDQLTVESPIDVAESVAGAVRALFLEIELESELRSGNIQRQQLMTNIICLGLRHITSSILLSELYNWLMGDSPEEDVQGEVITPKDILLKNCLHSDKYLSLNSMRLFEILLENCDEHVLHSLILRYLEKRSYYDPSSHQNTCMESWSDEEDAREREANKNSQGSNPSGVSSRTFAPSNIHKIIESFLQLLPSSLRSATDYQESGYHQYIAEAQRQYAINIEVCAPMEWPCEATFPNEEYAGPSSDSGFHEGPFLQMIFERLRGLAKQPYEMNLQLTALVSRLAMLPHPYVHEFLLNPLIPLVPGASSLYSTLQSVAHEMQTSISTIPNSKKMLIRTRHDLLGDASLHQEAAGETSCLFESIVVLEEFCKELAAIAYVKYHHSS